ncbi:hypothetical protein LOC67_24740 [Stieleria sp. JC731]|uniref:hypothetical protein n=1 Tax=Stieleria sp. JC731 TaxID=2894195 RepID=UPI001E31B379|nr:hypothetical protein [Stieleria sp. JC731]MCC9603771.1 hypothetical protein [Stieleria sp. JC731]
MLHWLRRILLGRDPLFVAIADADVGSARRSLENRHVTVIGEPRFYGDTADCIPSSTLAAQIAHDADTMDSDGPVNPYSIHVGDDLHVVVFTHQRYFRRYQRRLTIDSDQVVAIPKYDVAGAAIVSLIDQGSDIILNPGSADYATISSIRYSSIRYARPNSG